MSASRAGWGSGASPLLSDSDGSGMEMNDMSREPGDGRVYASCTAQSSQRMSSDTRESQNALVREGQIWEHTKIMQTSQTAHEEC